MARTSDVASGNEVKPSAFTEAYASYISGPSGKDKNESYSVFISTYYKYYPYIYTS